MSLLALLAGSKFLTQSFGVRRRITSLTIAASGGEPPSEFKIFSAGSVETTKGTFLFDAAAAASVMAEYAKHGIDLMIDYDHASLASLTVDPALAGKAAGWFNIELRNGELWAVNVRWTVPAAAALTAKEWRFYSPAFCTDESGRITSLLNVAVTNLPATRNLQPLMAASITALGSSMTPEMVKEALDALIAGDSEKCAELLKGLIAVAAGGETAAPAEEPAAEEPAPEAPAPEAMADAPAPAKEEDKKEEVVATSALLRSTGTTTLSAAIAQLDIYRASHIALETERQQLAAERAVIEAAERRDGCVKLVTLGGVAPSRVWADDKCSAPKKYLASLSIEDFREFVADTLASGKPAPAPKVPAKASNAVELSARELAMCAEMKIDPKDYAARKPSKKD